METVRSGSASGSGEESMPVKPSRPSNLPQETPPPPPYPDWPAPIQAYYGAGSAQPPFYPPPVASPSPYPYMWGGQHLMSPYGTPIPYPAMYPHGGLYPHPNMTMAQGAAITNTPMEGKGTPAKKVKNSGNVGLVGGKSKGSANGASGSGNDGVSQSAESGSEGSSEASEENFNHKGSSGDKKRSFDQMLADGANAQNTNGDHSNAVIESSLNGNGEPSANIAVPFSGNPTGDMATTNLNIGMDVWNASSVGTAPLRGRSNSSGVLPAAAPVTRIGHDGLGPEQLWVQDNIYKQDERELKRQRRKLSNRESARRSRLRKQAECEELQVKVEALNDENHNLRKELERLTEERQKLTNENTSLVGELTQLYGEDVVSAIKSKKDVGPVPPSVFGEGNGFEQDASNNSVSG